ncbi:O-antigen ligase family protein, partial [Patescibacteria group bacterium]|nr:O-antigen ligase family protein [Patescibacteria group bacterium]
ATGLSFSRASYIVLVIGMLLTFFFHKRLKAYMILSVVFAAILFLIPKPGGEGVDLLRKSSLFARSSNYRQIWEIIKNNTWLGVGFNAYRYAQKDYGFISDENWLTTHAGAGADNSFLFVWATTGFFGFLAFVYLWWRIILESYYSLRRSKTGLLVFVFSIVLVISSAVINSLFYPWILFWLVLLLSEFTVENELPTQAQFDSGPDQNTQS